MCFEEGIRVNRALPRIPADEYRKRWDKVQGILENENLDMLLAYADDRFTYGAAYARYYGNLPVAFEPVQCLTHRRCADLQLAGDDLRAQLHPRLDRVVQYSVQQRAVGLHPALLNRRQRLKCRGIRSDGRTTI
jgi:hypothetical protein